MVITDLEQVRVLDHRAAAERTSRMIVKRASIWLPSVPPISLNEANLHLIALLHLLETITVTELPTYGVTLQVEDVRRQLARLYTGVRFPVWKTRNKAICLIGLLMNSNTMSNVTEISEP